MLLHESDHVSDRNVPWSLKWKFSVVKTKRRRSTNSESRMQDHCSRSTIETSFIQGVFVCAEAQFVSASGRFSSVQRTANWSQWQTQHLSFWCLTSLCKSNWACPKRSDCKLSWDQSVRVFISSLSSTGPGSEVFYLLYLQGPSPVPCATPLFIDDHDQCWGKTL